MKKFTQARLHAIANVHRATLRIRLQDAPAVRAILQLFPRNMRKDVRIDASDYSNRVTFSLYMRNLDSLKDKKLMRVLETFATDPAWNSSSNDYTYDTPNRDYRFDKKMSIPMPATPAARWLEKHGYFWHDDKTTLPVEIQIFISAYVKQDSDSCRIEVVERV